MHNNKFCVVKGDTAADIPYGMSSTQGTFFGEPGTADSIVPTTNFHNAYYGPELPPRKDLYMTPQSTLAHPNVCEYSDTYVRMNPVRATVPEFSSELQYETTVTMAADNEKVYAEIPGDHLTQTFSEEQKVCDDIQYGGIPSSSEPNGSEVTLKPQDADKDETSDPNGSENAYVMD